MNDVMSEICELEDYINNVVHMNVDYNCYLKLIEMVHNISELIENKEAK